MTSDIFKTWIKRIDSSMTAQGRKILLLVDNCPAHPNVDGLRSVELVFLPPNCTSVLQPMDQGIIRLFKLHYRKQCLKMIIDHIDKTGARPQEQLNVLQAIEFVKKAWNTVSKDAINNCFLHGFNGSSSKQPVDISELSSLIEQETSTVAQEGADIPTAGKFFIMCL